MSYLFAIPLVPILIGVLQFWRKNRMLQHIQQNVQKYKDLVVRHIEIIHIKTRAYPPSYISFDESNIYFPQCDSVIETESVLKNFTVCRGTDIPIINFFRSNKYRYNVTNMCYGKCFDQVRNAYGKRLPLTNSMNVSLKEGLEINPFVYKDMTGLYVSDSQKLLEEKISDSKILSGWIFVCLGIIVAVLYTIALVMRSH